MTIGSIGNYYNNYNTYGDYNNYSNQDNNTAYGINSKDNIKDPTQSTATSVDDDTAKKPGYKSSPAECETCKERKYVDGSNENNVSFKSPAHISPESAGAEVRAHEGEHVSNAYAQASQNNGKVISANVAIHTAVCPECGRTYVSGGTTTTTIKYSNETNPYQQARKSQDSTMLLGANLDYTT